ncbi:MAG TPA: hypothetical protein VMZ50_06665 [Phycisphaerae bacterium]|nr:hypothetical protein [Phycisphaerae bacterium]
MTHSGLTDARAALAAYILEVDSRKGHALNASGRMVMRRGVAKAARAALHDLDATIAAIARLPKVLPPPPVEEPKKAPEPPQAVDKPRGSGKAKR